MYFIFSVSFVTLGLVVVYRYDVLSYKTYTVEEMKTILKSVKFWLYLLLPSIIMGEILYVIMKKRLSKLFKKSDPMDQISKFNNRNTLE